MTQLTPEQEGLSPIPSTLIRQALGDLRACELSLDYEINMGVWCTIQPHPEHSKCKVCLAGATIVQGRIPSCTVALVQGEGISITPDDFDTDTEGRLEALESFRIGNIHAGLCFMRILGP